MQSDKMLRAGLMRRAAGLMRQAPNAFLEGGHSASEMICSVVAVPRMSEAARGWFFSAQSLGPL